MSDQCSVERVQRSVMEKKLLVELMGKKDVVALLVPKDDLELLINSLRMIGGPRANDFANDLAQLRKEAFGP